MIYIEQYFATGHSNWSPKSVWLYRNIAYIHVVVLFVSDKIRYTHTLLYILSPIALN